MVESMTLLPTRVADRAAVDSIPTPSADTSARLTIGPGYVGYLGPALDLDPHSTAVGCLAVGLDARFGFRATATGEVDTRTAYSRARHTHQLVAGPGRMLLLLLEPTSSSTVDHQANMGRVIGPFGFEHRAEKELIAACQPPHPDFNRLLAVAGAAPSEPIDPRIARALRSIRADPLAASSADALARGEGISTSYFLRMFGDQTGTSFRRYKIWSRMLYAAKGFAAGHDLTRCSVDAGFASLSHFSRVFHSMFGLSATALLGMGTQLDMVDEPWL